MICDYRKNLNRYIGINEGLDKAISFLMSYEADKLEGKIELDGERVYVSAQENELAPMSERKWEVHHDYMDIHVGMTDGEVLGFLNNEDGIAWEQVGPDCWLSSDEKDSDAVAVPKDMCVILWPGEPHKPNTGSGKAKKLVAKIRI